MNRFARDMMMGRMTDSARGRGRDRNQGYYDYESDMARGRGSDGHYPMGMGETYYPIEAMGTFNGYYGFGGNDFARGGRGRGRDRAESYNDMYYEEDMARGGRGRDRNYEEYDMDSHQLKSKDIKKWEKELKNADGTRGPKYQEEQVVQMAKQMNIRFDEYSEELFTAIVNMMYSDYCKVLGGDAMLYIKLAKSFLEDEDFDGSPKEKAMLYYKCIVEKDDD